MSLNDSVLFAEFERERPRNTCIEPERPHNAYNEGNREDESKLNKNVHMGSRHKLDDRDVIQTSQTESTVIDLRSESSSSEELLEDSYKFKDTKTHFKSSDISIVIDDEAEDTIIDQRMSYTNNCTSNSLNVNFAEDYSRLKDAVQTIDTTRYKPLLDVSPYIQIVYPNSGFARKYRDRIENSIQNFVLNFRNGKRLPKLDLKDSTRTCACVNSVAAQNSHLRRTHAILGVSQMYDDFIVDRIGWPLVDDSPQLTDGRITVEYDQIFLKSLPCEDADDFPKVKRSAVSCFNCLGEHIVSECPKPVDMKRIKINRQAYRDNMSTPKPGLSSKSENEQYSHLKPGVCSQELRDAMSLKDDELPPFIYQMRLHGYPPGWKIDSLAASGLSVFGTGGKEVENFDNALQDGISSESPWNINDFISEIDVYKVIEYPGFTSEVPPATKDEWQKYGSAPLNPNMLKSNIILKKNARKRQMEDMIQRKVKHARVHQEADMDLDDGQDNVESSQPPLPEEDPPCIAPLPPDSPLDSDSNSKSRQTPVDSVDRDQLSLEDLERRRTELFAAIAKEDEVGDGTNDSEVFIEIDSYAKSDSPPVSATPEFCSKSIERSEGTPVRASVTPSLPDSTKFGSGIEEHIPFENLPATVGRFDNLRKILAVTKKDS